MSEADLDKLEQLEEFLALFFYFFMFVALLAALSGSTGSGFLVLILGSCIHVGRASIGELVEKERARGTRAARPAPASPPQDLQAERSRRAEVRASVRLGG
jgi:hypothetical protein